MGHHTPAARWGAQRRFRRACPKGSRGRAKRGEGTMDSEQGPPAFSASSTGATAASTSTTSGSTTTNSIGRQAVPQISVYSGIPDRQTVQVIQQALHRQPNTAAQYLQQMYAAQQQHLMLQTAALQQQHLSNAQLQSLAAVQQASIAAGRQSSTQNDTSSQQTGSSQATVSAINLTTSPAAAQLISRTQSVSSAPAGSISQQAVLLGSTSSPTTLTASQAHMYLRAQMAQQSNLVQVARSLGRAVPLSPQLIFTPTATVTAVQSESSTQSSGQQSAPSQVQNLAIRSQQGATMSSFQTHNLQALSLKQTPVAIQPSPLIKNPSQGSRGAGGKGSSSDVPLDGTKKGESIVTEVCAINMSRSVTALSGQPLSTPAYTQIPSHSLVQQHKQHQFVIQQTHASQRTQGQLLQTASIQPHLQTPSLVPQSPSQAGPIPVLPKPASHHQPSTPSQQATIFHSTISPHALHSSLSQAKAQPVQLTAINLQIQPALSQASRLVQDSKGQEKPKSLVVRELCPTPSVQQEPTPFTPSAPSPPQATKPTEQPKTDPVMPISQPQGVPTTKRLNAAPGTPPPAMTSGNENEAPTVTGSTPQNGENKPPQAIVKPQVLTHVIEGFVIQEGAEPFPIERLPVMMDSPKKLHEQLSSDPDKTPVSNPTNTTDSETEELTPQELKDQEDSDAPKLSCEFCGWVDFAYKFKGSKRFCSMVCAKRYNVGCTKRIGLFRPERSKASNRWRRRSHNSCRQCVEPKKQKLSPTPQQTQGGSVSSPLPSQPSQEESSPCSDMSSYEEPPSPLSGASSGPPAPQELSHQAGRGSDQEAPRGRELPLLTQHFLPNDPTKWNVEEVYEFIHSLPGMQNANPIDEVGGDTPCDVPCLQKPDSPTGSPPKQASLADMMEFENCVSNLSLAHEIVMNKDFSFRQNSPPKDSLEGRISDIVHSAFWDCLQEQLSCSPPDYVHAVILLQEVKTTVLSLLLPGHVRLKAQVEEVLDLELIQQQADHGALDLQRLSGYIINTMASLCAPVRDPEIKTLRDLSDPVELLRGIFRVLGLMKTDMVNFTVQSLRPNLLQQAVQYERAKFQEILEKQPEFLDKTTVWLQVAAREEALVSAQSDLDPGTPKPRGPLSPTAALNRAYLQLLSWDPHDQNYPETVLMDRARIDALGQRLSLLVFEASVLLLTSTQCGAAVFSLQGFVGKLKQTITALLEGSHNRDFDLQGALLGLREQVLVQVKEALITQEGPALPQDSEDVLKGQISDLAKDNNPIHTLIGERVQGYLQAMLEGGPTKKSPSVPPALRLLSAEVAELGMAFGQMVHFNRSVFGPFYAPILRKLLFPSGEAEMGEDSR